VEPQHSERDSQTIIDDLRQAITASGLTEYRIAKESNVPQPVLNRFLSEKRGISLETAAKLCTFLKLHLTKNP